MLSGIYYVHIYASIIGGSLIKSNSAVVTSKLINWWYLAMATLWLVVTYWSSQRSICNVQVIAAPAKLTGLGLLVQKAGPPREIKGPRAKS